MYLRILLGFIGLRLLCLGFYWSARFVLLFPLILSRRPFVSCLRRVWCFLLGWDTLQLDLFLFLHTRSSACRSWPSSVFSFPGVRVCAFLFLNIMATQ
jgi:hypothetical protein